MSAPAADLGSVLAALRENALALAVAGPQPPSRVRIEAAGAVVELTWPGDTAPSPAPVATAPPVAAPVPAPAALAAAPAAAPVNGSAPAPVADGHRLTSPTVGVFYRAPEPGAEPFVAEGDVVAAGQQVGIVEAMKLMIPVEADRAGRVLELLCGDGEAVEYGQALLVLGS